MSIDAVVFWLFVFAWLVVLGLIAFVAVPRAVREGLRITKRVLAFVKDSPVPRQIAKAEADFLRLRAAIDRLPGLQRRAEEAVAAVRATPVVPGAVIDVIRRLRREMRAFRNDPH